MKKQGQLLKNRKVLLGCQVGKGARFEFMSRDHHTHTHTSTVGLCEQTDSCGMLGCRADLVAKLLFIPLFLCQGHSFCHTLPHTHTHAEISSSRFTFSSPLSLLLLDVMVLITHNAVCVCVLLESCSPKSAADDGEAVG